MRARSPVAPNSTMASLVPLAVAGHRHVVMSTAWPPNSRRRAAITFIGEVALVLRAEPGVQRRGDDRRGHAEADRLLDRPAALARVLGDRARCRGGRGCGRGHRRGGRAATTARRDPCRHADSAPTVSMPSSLFSSRATPSAKACIIPYSMPLWTIFVKCPAPTGPTWAKPPSGARASKIGWALATSPSVAADHEAVAVVEAPHAAAGAAVDEADAACRRARRPAGSSRCSGCCRRR